MTLLLMILAAPYIAPAGTNPGTAVRQGVSLDGGVTWAVECSNCTADQRVYIVDAGAPLNVNFPATQAVSIATMPSTPVTGTFWQTTQPISGTVSVSNFPGTQPVSLASAPTTPITAAALPLPSGAATDATLSQLLDGGIVVSGRGPSGPVPVAVDSLGVQYVRAPSAAPLNPFLPRCNPVRRTGCQP